MTSSADVVEATSGLCGDSLGRMYANGTYEDQLVLADKRQFVEEFLRRYGGAG